MQIPFTRPSFGLAEERALLSALRSGQVGGSGPRSAQTARQLAALTGARHVLLTSSATAAIEVALIAAELGPGDEVLLPSFGYVSQATAVVARGATPVFCDVDAHTLNMDPRDAEARLTPRTRALFPVHYAGVAANLTALGRLARQHGLLLFEDAAHGIGATHRGRHLGTIGDAGMLSFHVTKNLGCGVGGALLLRDAELARRAEVALEKGTDRSAFLRGQVDKYTWVGEGGSFALSDLLAALLGAQLKRVEPLTRRRLKLWQRYHAGFEELEALGPVQRPRIPRGARHNAHTYFLLARSPAEQQRLLATLNRRGIGACFHFQPLHRSPFAQARLGPQPELPVTEQVAATILRLPLFDRLGARQVDHVIRETYRAALEA